ncbi:putative N-acetyltransferase YhbS [Kribbella amoyensis]|uniref:Putative N-acetyltransferase YhbS n=1 Tax=Kribbella amoyensis TaxID=996641 RepID=A0A561BYK3_9ACTN|nr:N-acetyltransferase [Kribbella amoyensis]TWD83985.1 putative N-acetyltransferase YhbS [Kribbella amoyensis]
MSTPSWITRAETTADVAAVREVNLQAFGRTYEPDIVDALRADPAAWLPGLSIIATTPDGDVVAHALLSRCHVDDVAVLSLGPVAVRPAYQRQGAGSAAIRAALDAGREAGEAAVVLLGHLEYYPRFGFEPAASFGITHADVTGPNVMALQLDPARAMPSGQIRYPAAWDI